jgi:uncharacterized protein YndB with AHSA1/START domain
MSGTISADSTAPVFATSDVRIAAPIEIVWSLMSRIDEWPTWNADVKEASLQGELVPGTTFRWKAGPVGIVSTLRRVEPPHSIAWTGRSLGIRAIHEWDLRSEGDATVVTTRESWNGMVPRLFRRSSQKALEKALRDGPAYLKTAAEDIKHRELADGE